MSLVPKELKAKAEVYHGDETCRGKFMLLLEEKGLPNCLLLTFQDIEECGYVKEIGFVWLKHRKKQEHHKFNNMLIWYDTEVTFYVEPNKIKNLTGVKAKEFWIWITLSEIYVDDARLITFKNPAGLRKSFPISVFQIL